MDDVDCYDCRLDAGSTVGLPSRTGWHTYLYVFEGSVDIRGETLGHTESALMTGDADVLAIEDSILVAFVVNPDAPITRQGTIGR